MARYADLYHDTKHDLDRAKARIAEVEEDAETLRRFIREYGYSDQFAGWLLATLRHQERGGDAG